MKIAKERFDKLYSEDITKKEYDRIIDDINGRFAEIVYKLNPEIKHKGWFDYGNCNYDSSVSGGYFDPEKYKQFIEVGGEEHSGFPEPYNMCEGYYNGFPTRWLWEDFEEEMLKTVNECKQKKINDKIKAKIKKEELKKKKAEFKEIITSKLTKEELKYITFK
jgi:hypothetical protein